MSSTVPPDPLIDEVRERRRQLLAAYGNDLRRLLEAVRRVQDEHPEKIVDRRKMRIQHEPSDAPLKP